LGVAIVAPMTTCDGEHTPVEQTPYSDARIASAPETHMERGPVANPDAGESH
jgi:hypothetical protein